MVITKHGKPVAKVIPIESGCAHLIGALKGEIRIHGDVFSTGWNGTPVKEFSTASRAGARRPAGPHAEP